MTLGVTRKNWGAQRKDVPSHTPPPSSFTRAGLTLRPEIQTKASPAIPIHLPKQLFHPFLFLDFSKNKFYLLECSMNNKIKTINQIKERKTLNACIFNKF